MTPKRDCAFGPFCILFFLAIILAEAIYAKTRGVDIFPELTVLFVILIAYLLISYYWYFIVPKIRYKAMAKLQEAENQFLFEDETVTAVTQSGEYSDEARMEYSLFVKAFETSKYFFLFTTHNQAYIVDKSTIEGGSAADIRLKLSSVLGNKYIFCKY